MMIGYRVGGIVPLMLFYVPVLAQPLPPGYVDPEPLLAAVAAEIGEAIAAWAGAL